MYVRNAEIAFDKNDLYYCYSPKQKRFLCKNKNINYVARGIHNETGKTYWLFLKTNELANCLLEWSNNAKNNTKAID